MKNSTIFLAVSIMSIVVSFIVDDITTTYYYSAISCLYIATSFILKNQEKILEKLNV